MSIGPLSPLSIISNFSTLSNRPFLRTDDRVAPLNLSASDSSASVSPTKEVFIFGTGGALTWIFAGAGKGDEGVVGVEPCLRGVRRRGLALPGGGVETEDGPFATREVVRLRSSAAGRGGLFGADGVALEGGFGEGEGVGLVIWGGASFSLCSVDFGGMFSDGGCSAVSSAPLGPRPRFAWVAPLALEPPRPLPRPRLRADGCASLL